MVFGGRLHQEDTVWIRQRVTSRATVGGILAIMGALAAPVSLARASPHPGIVVWAGPLGSETTLRGVVLQPSGQGKIVMVRAIDRGRGTVRRVGAFNPSPATLRWIRLVATAVFKTSRTSIRASGPSGLYASVTVQMGPRKHVVVVVNPGPSAVTTLLTALNGALPPSAQLPSPGSLAAADRAARRATPAGPLARSGSDPFAGVLINHSQGTAPCPPGDAATSVSEPVSLKDAAADGLVTLTTKGGFDGDTVAVDAHWGPLPNHPPVVLRMNFEITPPPELSAADQSRVVAGVRSAVASRLSGLKASDGTPLNVELNIRQRDPSQPPTPCFHQIKINQDENPDVTSAINTKLNMTGPFQPDPLPGFGEWSTFGTDWQQSGFSPKTGDIWTHEVLHFAGLDEAYHSAFQVDSVIKDFPADARFQNLDDVLAWARQEEAFRGLDLDSGKFRLISDPGHEHDYMGRCPDNPPCHVDQGAIDELVRAGQDNIEIDGSPGDLLLNKNVTEQSLGVGADFHLLVHRGTPAHVNGLVAYCIDLDRHVPEPGVRMDVLGRAGDQPDPSMQALQAVLDEVARRQLAPLESTEGGQYAVWRVTDDAKGAESLDTSRAILDAARIPPDATYVNPHYTDPNAGGASTAAVTPAGVLPATSLPPPRPPSRVGKPRLGPINVKQLAGRHRLLIVEVDASAADIVTVRLQRKQRKHIKTILRRRVKVHGGANFVALEVPRLPRGRYRVSVSGTATKRSVNLTVRR
jgi:hypothetical protein